MRAFRIGAGGILLLAVVASFAPADSAKFAVTGVPVHMTRVPREDPLPIRRIPVAETQVDAAVKEHGLGAVVRMPRGEFEAKVRRKAEERDSPRLVEANWTATFDNGDLTGEAEWTFLNRRSTPAVVSLDPLKIAILGATWADGSVGILGAAADGDAMTLRVPPGRSILKVKWSAAGGGTDADRQFDLRLPHCSTATLSLDVPPDRTPSIASDVLLTGPFPSSRDQKWKQWRFRFDRTRIELAIRGPSDTGGTLILANSVAKYDLADARLAAVFEFDLRTARGTLAEWLFQVPSGLTLTDASANDRAAWRFDAATRTVRVVLRQASAGGKFVLTASGPLPAAVSPLPAIRPANAIGSAERIELRVPPGVALERLDPGDYRIADATTATDGTHSVSLTGSFASSAGRKPPAIRAALVGAEFTTNETLEWKIDSNRVVFTARVEATVRRGPLFRIAFRPPPGFALDRVSSEPENAIAYAAATGEVVEFAKPLTAGQQVVLNFEYRGPAVTKGESRFAFPAFAPLGAAERDGRIRFAPGGGWLLDSHPTGQTSDGDPEKGIAYRGEVPGGNLVLIPVPMATPEPPIKKAESANNAAPDSRNWAFENLYIVTIATPEQPEAVFGGSILSRGDTHLALQLPPASQVLSVLIGGKQAAPTALLSLPDVKGTLRFEVRYRLPASKGPPFRINSALPELPGEATPIARWWAIPSEMSGVWPLTARTAASSGPLMLGPVDPALAFHRIDDEELTLVAASHAEMAGIAGTLLLAILSWIGFRLESRALGVLLLSAVISLGPAYWLGPDAWQRAAFPPLAASLIGVAAIAIRRGWNTRLAGLILAMLLASGERTSAQAPVEPNIVLLVNSPAGEIAIVPQTLLERLGTRSPEPAIEISAATYTGRIEDGLARFTAKFQVHALRDGEATFDLPLDEVRLERVAVNGQPAQPLASNADSYSIPLPGRGVHEVEVRFAVPVSTTGAEREVRFGIPAAPDSRLDFAAPLTARQFQVVSRNGGERVTKDKDASRVAAALGATRAMHLRWREGQAGAAATLTVREGCVWDVSESTHRLTACYQIQVKAGAVPGFRFDVPANLEPTRVAVRSLDSILVPTVVRDWNLGKEANGSRPLTIDLLAPTDGRVLVTLECEPRTPPVRQPVLAFPRPSGMTREFAVYGLRAGGTIVESIGRAGVIDFAADAMIREFGSVPDLRLAPTSQVTAFSPRAGEIAELRPVLRPTGTPPIANHDALWSVEKDRATGRGTLAWSAPDAVAMLEFQLAGMVVELRGTDLAAWSQTDSRVQVWMKKPGKDGTLEWTATAPASGSFEVPLPKLANGRDAAQVVRIRAAAGWGVRIDRDKSWRAVASEDREQAFQCDGPSPAPKVQVYPPGNAAARGIALLEFAGAAIAMRASLEVAAPAGQPHHFVLQAKHVPPGLSPILDVPPGTIVRERKDKDGSITWDLDVPAGSATTFRTTLGLSLPARGSVPLPLLDLRSGDRPPITDGVIRTFGLIGAPAGVELSGAKSDADLAALRGSWPGEAERLRRAGGSVYKSSGGPVSVVFPTPVPAAPAVESPQSSTVPVPERALDASTQAAWVPAAAWCGTALGVLLLFVRSPRSTWPEQLGLLGAMFGYAVAGQFLWGIAVYAVARNVWLFRIVLSARK